MPSADPRAGLRHAQTLRIDKSLIAVEGRKLRFRVALRDEREPIGEGFPKRAIIGADSVLRRVGAKRTA